MALSGWTFQSCHLYLHEPVWHKLTKLIQSTWVSIIHFQSFEAMPTVQRSRYQMCFQEVHTTIELTLMQFLDHLIRHGCWIGAICHGHKLETCITSETAHSVLTCLMEKSSWQVWSQMQSSVVRDWGKLSNALLLFLETDEQDPLQVKTAVSSQNCRK